MAYIYVITNQKNGKQYVGKTEKINAIDRFYEHIKDSKSRIKEQRPLYSAFNKYGVENFEFEILEEVNSNESIEREIYWINTLDTYGSTGYNATLGGEGRAYLDYDKIIEDYKNLQDMSEVAKINHCHTHSVWDILRKEKINILPSPVVIQTKYGKSVAMLDIKTEEVIRIFDSQISAARYLIEERYSNTQSAASLSSKISLVVRGKRKTCCGFKWGRVSDDI